VDWRGNRINRIFFHGSEIVVNHDAVGPSGVGLSAGEETTLCLRALGLHEKWAAAIQYLTLDGLGYHANRAREKLGVQRNTTGALAAIISAAFDWEILTVDQPGVPDPRTAPLFFACSAAAAAGRPGKEMVGIAGTQTYKQIYLRNERERRALELGGTASQVLYAYAVGALVPRHLEDPASPRFSPGPLLVESCPAPRLAENTPQNTRPRPDMPAAS